MNAKEYLIKVLSEHQNKLGITQALYEYYSYSNTHFVKIVPAEIVDGDSFDYELSKIIIDFENTFPGEMFCFLGESSLTKLENPVELINQNITGQVQTGNVVFTDEQLILNVFDSGMIINPNLITIIKHPVMDTQISCIKVFYSKSENDYRNLGHVAEPEEFYGKTFDYYDYKINQAA